MSYDLIQRALTEAIGLDPASLGIEALRQAVGKRLRVTLAGSPESYARLVIESPEELTKLIEAIVVSETWFFRDRHPFSYLQDYVKSAGEGRTLPPILKVLSAPCATGEEPCSIAITLLEAGLAPGQFSIDALDISEEALAKAAQAEYGANSFRFGSDLVLPAYFTPSAGGMKVRPEVTACINYHRVNLMTGTPGLVRGSYQLIFCRNLLIYLTSEARARVMNNLDALLVEGGLIFCGHSEVLLFKTFGYSLAPDIKSFACIKSPGKAGKIAPAARRSKPKPLGIVRLENTELAPLNLRAKSRPKSRDELPKAAAAGPDSQEVSEFQAARTLADRGELEAAEKLCRKVLRVIQPAAQWFCLLGEICLARQDWDEARAHLLKALYLEPQNYLALVHLTLLYQINGKPDQAEIYRRRLEKAGPEKPSGLEGASS